MKILRKIPILGALLGAFVLASAPPIASVAQAAPTIKVVTPSGLKSAIAKNKGKVVFVNFWATWCSTCVEELPALARLKRANAKKGLVVILVSGNEVEEKARATQTLKKTGHTGSYMIQGDIPDFGKAFDPQNVGVFEFPRSYIYNRKGQLVQKVTSDRTQAQWQKIINPYL